jgi:hypothetical protein
MNTFNSLLIYFLYILSSLVMLLLGFLATFHTGKFVNYYESSVSRGNPSERYSNNYYKIKKKKWFYLNLKICGIVLILMGLGFLLVVINAIMNDNCCT